MICSHCRANVEPSARFCPSCGGVLAPTEPLPAVEPAPEPTEYDLVSRALAEEYDVLAELGRGGMAIVYKARERQLERIVAVKVLPSSLAFDADFVERFEREARTAAQLEHPNIIPIYRVGRSGKVIYFVMKFLRGKSLAELLETRGALPPAELRGILAATASALGYAHKNGIVHRDIKPDNIMFDESGHAVVTDFGIAKAATGTRLTGTGMSIGTPLYMSPEQARAQPLDGRSDIYSLGIVMYQCLTGRVPFDGEDAFAIGLKHIMETVPTPTLPSTEHRALFEVVERMVAKQPVDRYQTAEELLAQLEAAGRNRDVWVAAPTMVLPPQPAESVAGLPSDPVEEAREPLEKAVSRSRRKQRDKKGRRALVAWLAVAVIIASGAVTYWYVELGASLPQSLVRQIQPGVAFANDAQREPARIPPSPVDSVLGESLIGRGVEPVATVVDSVPADSLATPDDSAVTLAADDTLRVEDVADTLAPPVETPGVLALAGLPRTARLLIDGDSKSGLIHSVEPGSHVIEVRASGYEPFKATVPVGSGDTVPVQVAMERIPQPRRTIDPCVVEPPPADYFSSGRCYDSRPSPRRPPLVDWSGDPGVRLDPVSLLVKVAPDGSPVHILRGRRQTAVPGVILTAIRFVRDSLRFVPAVKDGGPVEAWARVTVQFRRSP